MTQANLFTDTLAAARERFFERYKIGTGTVCPVCDRTGKLYRRKFNTGMAYALIWLYRSAQVWAWADLPDDDGWVNLRRTCNPKITSMSQYAHLKYWELAESKLITGRTGKRRDNGMYRLTPLGNAVARNKKMIRSHACIYNDTVHHLEGGLVFASECLNERFDYDQLMYAECQEGDDERTN